MNQSDVVMSKDRSVSRMLTAWIILFVLFAGLLLAAPTTGRFGELLFGSALYGEALSNMAFKVIWVSFLASGVVVFTGTLFAGLMSWAKKAVAAQDENAALQVDLSTN